MGRTYDERTAEKMAVYTQHIGAMTGAKGIITKNLLRDYCRIEVQLEDVNAAIERTGFTIENRQGNIVRNPDLMTQHQLINEKNALFSKLVKHLPEDKADALGDFVFGK